MVLKLSTEIKMKRMMLNSSPNRMSIEDKGQEEKNDEEAKKTMMKKEEQEKSNVL